MPTQKAKLESINYLTIHTLSAVRHPLSTNHRLPSTVFHSPSTIFRLLSTNNNRKLAISLKFVQQFSNLMRHDYDAFSKRYNKCSSYGSTLIYTSPCLLQQKLIIIIHLSKHQKSIVLASQIRDLPHRSFYCRYSAVCSPYRMKIIHGF